MESVTQFIFSQIEKDVETFFTFLAGSCWVLAFLAPEGNTEMNKDEQRKCADRFVQSRFKKSHKTKSTAVAASVGTDSTKDITK